MRLSRGKNSKSLSFPLCEKMLLCVAELQTEESATPEYADLEKKSNALGERFAQSFRRIAPFMEDLEVEKANELLMEVMGEMGE